LRVFSLSDAWQTHPQEWNTTLVFAQIMKRALAVLSAGLMLLPLLYIVVEEDFTHGQSQLMQDIEQQTSLAEIFEWNPDWENQTGEHLVRGDPWVRPHPYSSSADDLDGDGISNENDTHPFDTSMGDSSFGIYCNGLRDDLCHRKELFTIPVSDGVHFDASGDEMDIADIDGDGDLDLGILDNKIFKIYSNVDGEFVDEWHAFPLQHDGKDLTIADFNGDGDVDALVLTTHSLAMVENILDPASAPSDVFSASVSGANWNGGSFAEFEVDDINNDGFFDVIIAKNPGTFLLNGTSTGFESTVGWDSLSRAPTQNSNSIAIGDMNGDGLKDLIHLGHSPTAQEVAIFENTAQGLSSTPSWSSSTNGYYYTVEVADIDGDGDLDIAVKVSGDTRVYFNDDHNGIEPRFWDCDPRSTHSICNSWGDNIAVGDIDMDGMDDLLVAGRDVEDGIFSGHNITDEFQNRWLAHPHNEVAEIENIPWSSGLVMDTSDVALEDLDGNGVLDAILLSESKGLYIHHGQQNSISETAGWVSDSSSTTEDIVISDVNGDGTLDIITSGTQLDNLRVYRNTNGVIIPSSTTPAAWNSLIAEPNPSVNPSSGSGTHGTTVADMNGNGWTEVLQSFVVSGSDARIRLLEYDSASEPGFTFVKLGNDLKPSNLHDPAFSNGKYRPTNTLVAIDIDGDGNDEVVAGSNSIAAGNTPGYVIDWNATSSDLETNLTILDTPGTVTFDSILSLDSNQDGKEDLVAIVDGNPTLFNNTGGWLNASWTVSGTNLVDINSADINRDGFADLILIRNGNTMEIHFGSDVGFSTVPDQTHVSGTFFSGIEKTEWADINYDGYPEAILAIDSTTRGNVALWNNEGNITPMVLWESENQQSTIDIEVADLNGDGAVDVLTGNRNSNNYVYFGILEIDGDGIDNDDDIFPTDPTQSDDDDNDGFGNSERGRYGDICANTYGTSWRDRFGCADEDEDGQSNLNDDFWNKMSQWLDTDGDGYGDNYDDETGRKAWWPGEYIPGAVLSDESPLDRDDDGYEDQRLAVKGAVAPYDQCPSRYGTSVHDVIGCPDSDGDGISDLQDAFPGDRSQWNDTDDDGYGDQSNGSFPDACPLVHGTSDDDRFGCPDRDGDGWSDLADDLPDDPEEQVDSDNDGVGDGEDECPFNSGASTLDYVGCPDKDGDGLADIDDVFPNDKTQHSDRDEDGFGDNGTPGANQPDTCPDAAGESFRNGILGCPDSDGDGFADDDDECEDYFGTSTFQELRGCPDQDGDGLPNHDGDGEDVDIYAGNAHGGTPHDWDGDGEDNFEDDFPADRTQWADSDGDGYGDNWDPAVLGISLAIYTLERSEIGADWPGEYVKNATNIDWFPDDEDSWSDSDGDWFTDQTGLDHSDVCPFTKGTSVTPWKGCEDIDHDGIMDLSDTDADGDGIANSLEEAAAAAEGTTYDIYNASSTPLDTDGDGTPDSIDTDDDNDDFPDIMEKERKSDPLDANETPLNVLKIGGQETSGVYFIPGKGFSSQYDPDGYEMSLSMALSLIQSELLIPIMVAPLSLWAVLRKGRRFRRIRKRLTRVDEMEDLNEYESKIDHLIEKNKVKIQHGMLLRNLYERRKEEMEEAYRTPESTAWRKDAETNRKTLAEAERSMTGPSMFTRTIEEENEEEPPSSSRGGVSRPGGGPPGGYY